MTSNGVNGSSKSPLTTSSTIPLWLDGKETTLSSTFDVTSPLDAKTLYKCSSASPTDALNAVTSATTAFKTWSKTKPSTRRDIFLRAAEIFTARRAECLHLSNTETGAADGMFGFEYALAIDACKNVAGLIQTVQGSVPTPAEEGQSCMVLREPYGVVLGIAPWNAPFVLGLRACLQPLATGNTVVLKGPEISPGTYWAIASVLHEAGLPAGCLNTVYHRPADAAEVTNTLIAHPAVKKINFTGSTNTGAVIASLAGKYLKPTVMELGGKAPSIVCEDADLGVAALQCALGAFLHGGQICMSTERIIVHEKVVEGFKEALKGTMDQVFKVEGATLVDAAPVVKNRKLLEDAVGKGARTIYGDARLEDESKTRMRPVIIDNVNKDMDIYHTESFGPTVAIYTVKSDEEALQIANDTDYGLASAVFTEDLRRGLKIAKQIETGAVHINSMSVHDETIIPHGGAKKSGFGRFNSREGLEEWVRTKAITWKD